MNSTWQQALTIIRENTRPDIFQRWFEPHSVAAVEERGGVVYIMAKDQAAKAALSMLYMEQIETALETVMDGPVQVEVVNIKEERIPEPEEIRARPQPLRSFAVKPVFNSRYTFESFVVGSSNRFAHAAAMAVAESPSRSYNPLFIYGGSGLGKTHLMHAIGQAIMTRTPATKVVYVSSEAFTNEFISMLREKKLDAFKNRYRSTDILLIDDIQFLSEKEQTQEEFFHTFNALHDAGKQIVISSDRPPRDINPLSERLRSRFAGGLTCDIQPPDWETRCAILQQKAYSEDMKLDDEVAYYIADKIRANIRELEGALNKAIYYTQQSSSRHIDMGMAREALRGLLPEDEAPKLTVSVVQRRVAEYFQVSVDDLKSKKKDRYVAHPRQVAMYLCRELVGATTSQIGRDFGNRDHTTVMYACDKVKENRKADSKLDRDMAEIERGLKLR